MDYRLKTVGGVEYIFDVGDDWQNVLAAYMWQEVRVIGLLDTAFMTLIPQKIYPKGPASENVIDLPALTSREVFAKIAKKLNDFVVIPAALGAIFAL